MSSEEADPTLSPGWSYYCEVMKYNAHLATGIEKEVVSPFVFCYVCDTNFRYSGRHVSIITQ